MTCIRTKLESSVRAGWPNVLLFASEQKAPSTEIAFTDDILLEIRRILSPFDTADLKLSQYTEGSHGPDQSDTLCLKYGYKHSLQW